MTDTTDGARGDVDARWAEARVSALAAGAVAAGLGLGVLAAVVLLLWIGSPFPDRGLDGALHVGAGMWLLAQGAELVRAQTLSGDPAPLAMTPLLLSTLPAWLLYRGTASAVAAEETRDAREVARVAGWVLVGYLSVVAVTVVYASGGAVHVNPPTALYVLLFAAVAVGCGAWTGCGRPFGALRGYGEEVRAALRVAGIAAGLLAGGGALLGGVSLAWHAGAAGQAYGRLSGPLAGRCTVLLIAVALVPNLAVWGASYALGAGFSVGVGSAGGAGGRFGGRPVLPDFPLLAAVPGPGGGGVGWAALVVPVAAGGAVAWCGGRVGGGAWRTVRIACGAALSYGAGCAVLAAWAGGPLGTGLLADFGPTWWSTGAAASGWALAIGLPGALALRRDTPHPCRTLARTFRRANPSQPDPLLPSPEALLPPPPDPPPSPTPPPESRQET